MCLESGFKYNETIIFVQTNFEEMTKGNEEGNQHTKTSYNQYIVWVALATEKETEEKQNKHVCDNSKLK